MGLGIPFPGRAFLVSLFFKLGTPTPLPNGGTSKNLQELVAAWQDYPSDVADTLVAWDQLQVTIVSGPPATTIPAMVAQFELDRVTHIPAIRDVLTGLGAQILATPPVYPVPLLGAAETLDPLATAQLTAARLQSKNVASRVLNSATEPATIEAAATQLQQCATQLDNVFLDADLATLSTQFALTAPTQCVQLQAWLGNATIPVGNAQVASTNVCAVATGAVVATLSDAPTALGNVQSLLAAILAFVNTNAGGPPVAIAGTGAPFATLQAWRTAQGF